MGHDLHIVAIAGPEILQAVGEAVAAVEMLVEGREAGRHGAAPGVDHFGVRQDPLDEAQVSHGRNSEVRIRQGRAPAPVKDSWPYGKAWSLETRDDQAAFRSS